MRNSFAVAPEVSAEKRGVRSWLLIEKAHDSLPFDDSRRTVARALSPLGYLIKPKSVFHSWPMNGDDELGHWPNLGRQLISPEFRDR
jgi:hypothetical protein